MIKLTKETLRAILPRAPQAVIDAFVAKQDLLTKAGINATRARMAYFFANIEHECGGFTIPNLTENIGYTAARMAAVWPNRFASAGAVQAKYGTAAGWQKKAFDDIYGNRMGNRKGTSDGSTYIGRGGPQWTGRDGYAALERLTGIPAVASPGLACQFDMQPEVCTAFWTWKNLNHFADAGDFVGCVKVWNGGTNGMADRQHLMAGNDPIIKRLETVNAIAPSVPVPKGAPVSKADAAKATGGAVVAGTITAGAHQGWGAMQWGIAAAVVIGLGLVGWLVWRWWKNRQAAPATYYDNVVAPKKATADLLPGPAAMWASPAARTATTGARAPRKPAAKPRAKQKAKRKTTKRKAA